MKRCAPAVARSRPVPEAAQHAVDVSGVQTCAQSQPSMSQIACSAPRSASVGFGASAQPQRDRVVQLEQLLDALLLGDVAADAAIAGEAALGVEASARRSR